MKKTINITLGGLIFDIEEDAYSALDGYFNSIKDYYASPSEEKEILEDIESGIAEKFSDKINSKKKIVTLSDVNAVIKIMGTVDEIKQDSSKESAPNQITSNPLTKRLYRNTDDVVIAGVCSGIASYFGVDPVWIRLLFVVLVFVEGFGVLAYIVLWIIVPKAQTASQKLEMRGKEISLAKIEEVVKSKSEMLKKEGQEVINKMQDEKSSIHKILNMPFKLIERLFTGLKTVIKSILPLLSIASGTLLSFVSFVVILALTIAAGVLVFNINSVMITNQLPLYALVSIPSYYVVVISTYLVVLIPAILFLTLGITLIKRKNEFKTSANGILVGIWMIAIVTMVISAVDFAPKAIKIVDENPELREVFTDPDSYIEIEDFFSENK
jgi:phage shock protein PspC (stress-responsive transcriptional regulator)